MPRAINAPSIAPITDEIPKRVVPARSTRGAPKDGSTCTNQRNNTPTIRPITIRIAPTALLFPDPKYAVKIPAITLATANTSINMLSK